MGEEKTQAQAVGNRLAKHRPCQKALGPHWSCACNVALSSGGYGASGEVHWLKFHLPASGTLVRGGTCSLASPPLSTCQVSPAGL